MTREQALQAILDSQVFLHQLSDLPHPLNFADTSIRQRAAACSKALRLALVVIVDKPVTNASVFEVTEPTEEDTL